MQNRAVSTHPVSSTETSSQTRETLVTKVPIPFLIPLIVRCAGDLENLQTTRNPQRLRIILRISGLPTETSKQWESKLNSCLQECGCSLGAKCAIAAFATSLVWQSVFSLWSVSHWPVFLLRTFLLILAAGAAGKSAAKVRARFEIQSIEDNIRDFERRYVAGG